MMILHTTRKIRYGHAHIRHTRTHSKNLNVLTTKIDSTYCLASLFPFLNNSLLLIPPIGSPHSLHVEFSNGAPPIPGYRKSKHSMHSGTVQWKL